MKKIMFNDKFLLTKAVLNETKTMTRRIIKKEILIGNWQETERTLRYKNGEVVAVAQNYKNIYDELREEEGDDTANKWWAESTIAFGKSIDISAGNNNKMFVRADFMPYHIKITDVRVERLQDITNEDCLKEGIRKATIGYYVDGLMVRDWEKESHRETESGNIKLFPTPKLAYASLINKICGKGTWERNPWVEAYTFERVD